ncbi:sensor histidine kinase [Microbacteriaceae bacterium 4G12]
MKKEQKHDVNIVVNGEEADHRQVLRRHEQGVTTSHYTEYTTINEPFYFVLSVDGKVLHSDVPLLNLQNDIIERLKNSKDDKIYEEVIDVGENEIHTVVRKKPVVEDGKLIGYVYGGINVTSQVHVLQKLLWIYIVLGTIFLGVAACAGAIMAKRAMKPILFAYENEKRFVSDASHELRTPLSILQLSLEVLEKEEMERSEVSKQTFLMMKDEVKRMRGLVHDLLELTRIDAGNIVLRKQRLNITDIAKEVAERFSLYASQKDVTIHIEGEKELFVDVDRDKTVQLLYIVLDNAITYSRQYGNVTLSLKRESHHCVLSISDTGIGIEKHDLPHIFDRFYRGDLVRTGGEGKTGLGLSLAKKIVTLHGGRIWAESEQGQGSTFYISFPLSNASYIRAM